MTFLEKLKEEIPNKNSIWYLKQVEEFCPGEFGYEDTNPECDYDGCDIEMCVECWNREMPNTEAKDELKERLELIDELKQVEYNKGLNDGRNEVWELVKKLFEMENDKFREIFPPHTYVSSVMNTYTPQEAIAKLKAYEEAQSKVVAGDVVEDFAGNIGVVVGVYGSELNIVHSDGKFSAMISMKDCKKTGKHIDIQSILEQIGE